jgi:hypothetical protein
MTTVDAATGRDLEANTLEYLLREVEDHQMTVLLDQGTHRHLRFAKPGTGIWSFNLITWPGYLTICGDLQTHVFRRLPDMFEFFGSNVGRINAHYWGEKLTAPSECRTFSAERFRAAVKQQYDDAIEGGYLEDAAGGAWAVIESDVLTNGWGEVTDETSAYANLAEFSWPPTTFHRDDEAWRFDTLDMDMRDFDWHYLLCCHAIVWGIAKYREAQGVEAKPVVEVEAL